jgi:hypothetical protein
MDIDEGVYGSSDISSEPIQQLPIRPSSVDSSQPPYQDSLKRFEQLYSLVERYQQTDIHTSPFTSDSLYV